MEENLKIKHIITIPDGCIAQIDDNKIIIKEKQPEFKDGDILICDYTGPYNLKIIMIYKGNRSKTGGYNCYAFRNHIGQIIIDYDCCDDYVVRLATDKEKQELFDYMRDNKLQWNAEEKKVEKFRWRAQYGKKYYRITFLQKIETFTEHKLWYNDIDYESYNYYKTYADAEEALNRIKRTLSNYNNELDY